MQVPVLSYHAVNIISNEYAGNDHIALAGDLRRIHALGYRVISLRTLFDWHQGQLPDEEVNRSVAITFDDGAWFDFYDLEHPTCGLQRGMLGVLQDFRDEFGPAAQAGLHATSFVIASPGARQELDQKGLVGRGWWGDDWWGRAQASGLMSVECHSWDHNHPDLDRVAQRDQQKGSFTVIDNLEDCETQVARAGDYIHEVLRQSDPGAARPSFFAYPWGESSEYLLNHYMPEHCDRHGFEAAFSTDPRPVRRSDNRWNLPRFMFGRDWRSLAELETVLAGG